MKLIAVTSYLECNISLLLAANRSLLLVSNILAKSVGLAHERQRELYVLIAFYPACEISGVASGQPGELQVGVPE